MRAALAWWLYRLAMHLNGGRFHCGGCDGWDEDWPIP